MPIIDGAGTGRINTVAAGVAAAPPMVFIHPVGLDLTWWSSQIEAFSSRYLTVAYDLPGHGYSTPLEGSADWDRLASGLEAVIASVGGKPAHIVGTSIGGMIAQAFVLRRPDLVRSLSLVTTLSTVPGPGRAAMRERAEVARTQGMWRIAKLSVERWFPDLFRTARPDMMDRAIKNIASRDRDHQAAIWELISNLDFSADLSRITAPTVVVATDADPNVPVAACEQIAAGIAGSRLVVLPGIGHLPSFEAPDLFNDTIRRFVDQVDGHDSTESQ